MFKKILIPIDGSELSMRAAGCGIQLAKEMNAVVVFVHAKSTYIIPYAADVAMMDSKTQKIFEDEINAGSQTLLADAKRLASGAGVASECIQEATGRPEVLIEKTARELHCDLVVIATHGRGAVGRFVMGSVTTRLLPTCPVPVLVYRDASMTSDTA